MWFNIYYHKLIVGDIVCENLSGFEQQPEVPSGLSVYLFL